MIIGIIADSSSENEAETSYFSVISVGTHELTPSFSIPWTSTPTHMTDAPEIIKSLPREIFSLVFSWTGSDGFSPFPRIFEVFFAHMHQKTSTQVIIPAGI